MLVLARHLEIYNSPRFKERQKLNHEILLFLVSDVQNISLENFNNIINDLNTNNFQVGNSRIKMFLSEKPAFEGRWKRSLHDQNQFLSSYSVYNNLSFELKKGLWLNYQVTPAYTFYQMLVYLVLFDFLLLSMYLFYLFSLQRFKLPLVNFKKSAEKLGIDINTSPIKIFGPEIAQETANAMNKLQTRIKELIENRTLMLAAISHDLRTCVTRLKLRSHFLPPSPHLSKVLEDLTDMELMIEDILNFAGEDMIKEKKTNFDIVVLLYSVCEDFMDRDFPVHISSNCQRLKYFGRRVSLKRTFMNLIQNALKYAGEVWVEIECAPDSIQISIEDNGPGIPESELQNVFQAFYRSPQAHEKHVGFGLGLTICKEVIKSHDGTIHITNRKQGGLRADIILKF